MRILYINGMGPTEKSPLGGIFVSQRIAALKNMGVQVIPVNAGLAYSVIPRMLLRLKHIPDNGKLLDRQLNIHYHIVAARMNLADTWRARSNPDAYRKVLRRDVYGKLERADADLIHLHWCWPVGLILPELAAEKGIPYVLTFHGSDINIQLRSPVIKQALLNIMEQAASVEFISQALLNNAIESGYSGKNAVVIYNGIDTDIFCQKADRNRIKIRNKNRKKCVGFVGNLLPVKGADRLPAIFSKINAKFKGEAEFIVVGKGILAEKIKEQMKGLPVKFTGQLSPEKLSEVYNRMDILLVPSRNEGYSCAVKEAQACGVIPVGCNVGGIPEAVGAYGSAVSAAGEEELCESLAERAVDYLEGRLTVNLDEMVSEAGKCSWTQRQKESLSNYEKIKSLRIH